MQTRNPFLDDMARVAGGAMSALSGVRGEVESQVRAGIERMIRELDLVTREEHAAAMELAARARAEQETLSERLEALEARVDKLAAGLAKASVQKRPRKPAAGKTTEK